MAIAFNPFPKISAPDFTDVPKGFWAYSGIQIAASGGFVGGFSNVYYAYALFAPIKM
ncbi:S-layer homology domain-containing protein [Nostoc sp. CCCryo 231-06]|nr:S-layer homology domain-containing protein [Nostoc commune]MCL6755384.1 S-layer homology domain-containing protein [Nostoc sp. CCCryo 231-06]